MHFLFALFDIFGFLAPSEAFSDRGRDFASSMGVGPISMGVGPIS
jgi:hypothetical protein